MFFFDIPLNGDEIRYSIWKKKSIEKYVKHLNYLWKFPQPRGGRAVESAYLDTG